MTYDKIVNKENLEIEFNDVTFHYKEAENIFENISLVIKYKENITFAKRTGVGKSTLFKLILGLMEPNSGSITLGGVKVIKIPNHEKRKIFGYVQRLCC